MSKGKQKEIDCQIKQGLIDVSVFVVMQSFKTHYKIVIRLYDSIP